MPKSWPHSKSKYNRDERHTDDSSDEEEGLLDAQYDAEGKYKELSES